MLNHWLSPINNKIRQISWSSHQLGSHIRFFENDNKPLDKNQIAIIGIGENYDAVRLALYGLSWQFNDLKLIDLGNVRKKDTNFVIPLLKELLEGKITPLIIGDEMQWSIAQYQAHHHIQTLTNLTVVDEKIDLEAESANSYLGPIFKEAKSKLFNLSVLGYQSHFVNPDVLNKLDNHGFSAFRLGKIRNDITEAEPLIRDADLCCFNLNAIRGGDAPGQMKASPNGFLTDEICQLARYAGMSDKLTSIGFYGYQAAKDINELTTQLLAQMMWYFLHGYFNRKQDFPISTEGMVEYIVESKIYDYQLTFWRSTRSGRWWLQIPVKTNEEQARHRLIPCSPADYQATCQEDLPDRLWQAMQRFQ